MSPLTLLLYGISFILFVIYFYWPVHGIYDRWTRRKRNDKRILIEDALKYIYDCAYKKVLCNVNSIAGNLSISAEMAGNIAQQLEQKKLITSNQTHINLTQKGEEYALRIIRIHRLLERYMADETGIREEGWHQYADRDEHHLTDRETEQLSKRMGHPVIDPHGDPIPSASGEIPQSKSVPLRSISSGQKVYIQHIEDEPHSIYLQILKAGIHPALIVDVVVNDSDEIVLQSLEGRHQLTPLASDNVSVQLLPETRKYEQSEWSLRDIPLHHKVSIISISPAIRGRQRRRLMDFGFTPGAQISKEMNGPMGDPASYVILDTMIALRSEQSKHIYVTNPTK